MAGKALDLDSEFDAFNKERLIVRCATCKLPPELKVWADSKSGASAQSLAQFITNKGYPISASAIVNHRNAKHDAR